MHPATQSSSYTATVCSVPVAGAPRNVDGYAVGRDLEQPIAAARAMLPTSTSHKLTTTGSSPRSRSGMVKSASIVVGSRWSSHGPLPSTCTPSRRNTSQTAIAAAAARNETKRGGGSSSVPPSLELESSITKSRRKRVLEIVDVFEVFAAVVLRFAHLADFDQVEHDVAEVAGRAHAPAFEHRLRHVTELFEHIRIAFSSPPVRCRCFSDASPPSGQLDRLDGHFRAEAERVVRVSEPFEPKP